MKIKKYINMDSEVDLGLIKVRMVDNGEWGYDRLGIGEYDGKVFMVDLDRDEMEVEMEYVKEGLRIKDVLCEGVSLGVIVESGKNYKVNCDCGWDEDEDMSEGLLWKDFYKKVLINDKI